MHILHFYDYIVEHPIAHTLIQSDSQTNGLKIMISLAVQKCGQQILHISQVWKCELRKILS